MRKKATEMKEERGWWGAVKRGLVILGMSGITLAIVGPLAWAVYARLTQGSWPGWSGIGAYTDPSGEFHPPKTLWDLWELLIIPLVLAVGVYWLNRQEREAERELAAERERENALQTYLDKMGELMLERELLTSGQNSEVRAVARARTLTTLRMLDTPRRGILLRFLSESNLINKNIVDMRQADLRGIDLHEVDLGATEVIEEDEEGNIIRAMFEGKGATLSSSNLSRADLRRARLVRTDLTDANLQAASLNRADLTEAKLVNARLNSADLQRALLSKTNLETANLFRADLQRAQLIKANLGKTNLSEADLREAMLLKADLKQANLSGSRLSQADLSWVDLRGATNITDEQLAQAKALRHATMPDGSRYDGRFNLAYDIKVARSQGVDTDDPEMMKLWYAGKHPVKQIPPQDSTENG